MIRKILIAVLLLIATGVILAYGIELYLHFFPPVDFALKSIVKPIPSVVGMEAGPIKISISEETPWETIAKLVSTVLVTYLGIKTINKYVK